ncbi:Transposase [Chlamydiales bacterium STE3]|nr:Transposase [Chlamydiales bacterium STE3]
MDKSSKKIIGMVFSTGKKRDFRLFKELNIHIHKDISALTDSGYLGLQKLLAKTQTPKKKSKKSLWLGRIRKITKNYLVNE